MTKPIFPFIRYTLPENAPAEVLPENAGLLASNLRVLGQTFGVDMRRAIDDMVSVTLFCELYKQTSKTQKAKKPEMLLDAELEEYFNNEVLYIEYSLCNDRFTEEYVCRGDDHTIQGLVRLAMLLFHNTVFWGFYPLVGPFFALPITTLEAALQNTAEKGEVLIWASFVGYCAARFLPKSRQFFLHSLVTAVREYNTTVTPGDAKIDSIDGFCALLQRHFYVERCYFEEAREVWQYL